MDELCLSTNAAAVLKKLHSEYKNRLRNGKSKSEAAEFEDSKAIHQKLFPKWTFDDVDAACAELLKEKLLEGFRADGYVYCARLSQAGISFCQGFSAKNASRIFGCVLELVQAIRSLLPW